MTATNDATRMAPPPANATMELSALLRGGAKIDEIAAALDEMEPEQRAAQVLGLGRREQGVLYDRAADAPPIELAHFVPDDVVSVCEVVHRGMNSQPLFRRFEKRFCRADDGSGRLFGYNETGVRPLIGPGFFVAQQSEGGEDNPRGAVVVDYYQVPDAGVPASWPRVVPNHVGLQRFVYNKTRDYMRRVSRHVSIGKAFRNDRTGIGYFVLCRAV